MERDRTAGRAGAEQRTRAQRGGEFSPRAGPPGRETTAAETNVRRGWGSRIRVNRFGMFTNDLVRVFAEVGVFTLPVLVALPLVAVEGPLSVFQAWLAATALLVFLGTLVRCGWVPPLLTDAPGWVRLKPTLLVLRALYFNLVLLVGVGGALAVAAVTGVAGAGLGWAVVAGSLGALLFPRVTDEWMVRVA